MNLLMQTAANPAAPYEMTSLAIVGIVGFLAATIIGSIAWYNSKRLVGWEDKKRPDLVPEVDVPEIEK